eukprot:symbB.v1.2.034497.t1/scaffold4463.1/size39383/2
MLREHLQEHALRHRKRRDGWTSLEVNCQGEDSLDTLRRAQNEITEIKRQRLENEEEIDRLKVMSCSQSTSTTLWRHPAKQRYVIQIGLRKKRSGQEDYGASRRLCSTQESGAAFYRFSYEV